MKKIFIDTNIFLRYLTADDAKKYERCRDLFKKAASGKVVLVTSGLVIAELVWTLLSFYKLSKTEVVEKVSLIVGFDGFLIPDKDMLAESLVLYGRKNIDFIDAYNAIFMRHHKLASICSYDEDFDIIEDIAREEP